MKRIIACILLLFTSMSAAMACDLCEEQQPKWLRGVVHGPGPQGTIDYIITFAAILFVLVVLYYSIKFLVKPGEKNRRHIKYSILNSNQDTYGQQ